MDTLQFDLEERARGMERKKSGFSRFDWSGHMRRNFVNMVFWIFVLNLKTIVS